MNANTASGSLQAELSDAEGKTIPGYSADDCLPISKNEIVQEVRWQNHDHLPESEHSLKIRFLMTNGELFGFYAGSNVVRIDEKNDVSTTINQ